MIKPGKSFVWGTLAALVMWTVLYLAITHDAEQKCLQHFSAATCQETFR